MRNNPIVPNELTEGFGSLYMIEARKRDSGREWEPVYLSTPGLKFHYACVESALEALNALLSNDRSIPHLVMRVATGKPTLDELLEFRIVEVRAIREAQGAA